MKKRLQILLMVFFILPCIILFKGCNCSTGDSGNNSTKVDVTYTVFFYTGIAGKFNIPNQEIKEGELVREPSNFPNYYYDVDKQKEMYFNGWYSDISFDIKYLWKFQTDEVHSNLTLYARWEEANSNN